MTSVNDGITEFVRQLVKRQQRGERIGNAGEQKNSGHVVDERREEERRKWKTHTGEPVEMILFSSFLSRSNGTSHTAPEKYSLKKKKKERKMERIDAPLSDQRIHPERRNKKWESFDVGRITARGKISESRVSKSFASKLVEMILDWGRRLGGYRAVYYFPRKKTFPVLTNRLQFHFAPRVYSRQTEIS